MYFIQNLSEVEKMELFYELTFHTFWTAYLFSMVTIGRGGILALGNPTKQRDTWKGKYESMEHKYFTFQKELADLQGKVKLAEALQEEERIHNSLSTLVIQITKLESSLEVEKKRHQETSNVGSKENHQVEEDKKNQREHEAHVEALKAQEGEIVALKERFRKPL